MIGPARDDRFLDQEFETVGEGLQQAERTDHVRPFAQLRVRKDLALGVSQICDGDQQRHHYR
jgi:hypothetical protein